MHTYILVSSCYMLGWAMLWSQTGAHNVVCKLAFAGLGVWGFAVWLR